MKICSCCKEDNCDCSFFICSGCDKCLKHCKSFGAFERAKGIENKSKD